MRPDYVDLNRTFLDFDDDHDIEGAAFKSYIAGLSNGLDWAKLLQSKYVVILGEPGSGKTWELEAHAEKLRNQGHHSFFIRIDSLATQSFDAALDANDVVRFSQWQDGGKEATFFLDSVDEAKLQKPQAFYDALNTFARGVGSKTLTRTRIVMTCRVSEWQGKTDLFELRKRFSIVDDTPRKDRLNSNSEESPPLLRVVQLAPLDEQRVQTLAAHLGINDTKAFIADIEAQDAWDFVGRPKDVENVAAYWQEHHRLGTRTQMIEFDITHKLQETGARKPRDPLTPKLASQSAQALAAAVLFCRRFTFIISDDPINTSLVANSIDPGAVLPQDWTQEQVKSILNRAIFDEATYGKVRFHHRSIADYLAARWVAERVEQGCTHREVESLLFSESHGRHVVIPSRAPIAAWLVAGNEIWNQRICRRIIHINPDILLIHGDPEALQLEVRRELLNALVTRYADRNRVRLDTDAAQLRRLAHNDLVPDIDRFLLDPKVSVDIRELLLRLAQHGKLTGCVDTALHIVATKSEEEELRRYAVRVVLDCGNSAQLEQLAKIVKTYDRMTSRMCGLLCESLYPKVVGVGELIALLQQSDEIPRNSVMDLPYTLEERISKSAPDNHLPDLLIHLTCLAEQRPRVMRGGKETGISQLYHWLGGVLLAVVRRLLMRPSLDEQTSNAIVHAFPILAQFVEIGDHHEPRERALHKESEAHPAIRRAYVWDRVAALRTKNKDQRITFYGILDYYAVLGTSTVDQEWLLNDITGGKTEQDRETALHLAIELWSEIGQPQAFSSALKRAVRGHPGLQHILRHEALNRLVLSLRRFWYRHVDRWTFKNRVRRFRIKWRKLYDRWWCRTHVNGLRNGKYIQSLYYLANYRPNDESLDKYGKGSWQALVPEFGKRVAQAVRSGWKASWRKFIPQLPYERQDKNRMDFRVIVGLTGIRTEIEDGLDIAALSSDEAIIATHYAVSEINGFPDWLTFLASIHPEQVRSILDRCIRAEWSTNPDQDHIHGTLSDIRYSTETIRILVAPTIMELLKAGDPPHSKILNQALIVLLNSPDIIIKHISDLATRRICSYRPKDGHFLVWLVAWLHLDGAGALDFLETFLLSDPAKADSLMETLGSILYERRSHDFPTTENPSYQSVACLARLIPLYYSHVRLEDDINRSGSGVYSPITRDDAQYFRGALLEMLYQSLDSGVFATMQALLDDQRLASHRDWLLHILDKRAEKDAEAPPWQAQDIAEFTIKYEVPPRSADALFQIALKRLDDIQDLVECDDFSRRTDLRPEDPESALQTWMADQLRSMSRDRYEVVRELEVDGKKEPDIRLVTPGLNPTTVEIKWAHNWSYSELEAALTNQLVNLYMRSNKSRHGILVLANAKEKRWEPEKGKQLDFKDMVSRLRTQAIAIVDDRNDIDSLEVISIDFRPPKI